ncbi:Uncharacterized protein dnm_039360 [Desulfonema magnum]|uniref:Uncharacterized protein n=1 Tax=Desulfonema magnum TaxID=45655 RepID=A0A975GNF2_9BACT|nr:Uncharacterized protein dnm_039360 [Desulfonema magnum]
MSSESQTVLYFLIFLSCYIIKIPDISKASAVRKRIFATGNLVTFKIITIHV